MFCPWMCVPADLVAWCLCEAVSADLPLARVLLARLDGLTLENTLWHLVVSAGRGLLASGGQSASMFSAPARRYSATLNAPYLPPSLPLLSLFALQSLPSSQQSCARHSRSLLSRRP